MAPKLTRKLRFIVKGSESELLDNLKTVTESYLNRYPNATVDPFIIGDKTEALEDNGLVTNGKIYWSESKSVNLNKLVPKLLIESLIDDTIIIVVPFNSTPGKLSLTNNSTDKSVSISYTTLEYTADLNTKEIRKLSDKELFDILMIDSTKPYGFKELDIEYYYDSKLKRSLSWRKTTEARHIITSYVRASLETGYYFEQVSSIIQDDK